MTGISRWGSRLQKRLASAAHSADELSKALQDITPAMRVTQAALDYDTADKVAQQLGRALSKAMGGSGSYGGYGFEVRAAYRADCDWYEVEVINRGFMATARAFDKTAGIRETNWVVTDEVLSVHTKSVETFNRWVNTIAADLKVMHDGLRKVSRSKEGADGWVEAVLELESEVDHALRLRRSEARLQEYGVRAKIISAIPEVDLDDEAEAIESIRRALNADAE